jgi:dihydroorotate dehydrogenase (fumarate)
MANLESKYLGIKLKNPLIVSSSGLTDSVSKIKKIESYGAGGVVVKSLFEEQINYDAGKIIEQGRSDYPEAEDYINNYAKTNSVNEYLQLIRDAKKEVDIPVMASINCFSASRWIEFASKIEEAGADALELNVYAFPSDKKMKPSEYEKIYLDIAAKIKETIKIPFVFKLGSNFTNLVYMVDQLYYRGAAGVVLFNRFYQPDIDLNNMSFKSAEVFSSPGEISRTLRWVGIVSDQVEDLDIAGSTGVHDGLAAIKLLLAGATVTQTCSVLYKNGLEYIKTIISEMEEWMGENNFKSIDDFRGKLSYSNLQDPAIYERSQFMKYFSGIS